PEGQLRGDQGPERPAGRTSPGAVINAELYDAGRVIPPGVFVSWESIARGRSSERGFRQVSGAPGQRRIARQAARWASIPPRAHPQGSASDSSTRSSAPSEP